MTGRNPFAKPDNPPDQQPGQPPTDPTKVTPWEIDRPPAEIHESSSGRAHIDGIPTANWQPRPRKKDTRKRPKTHWLSLIAQNKERLEKQADALNVPEYEFVRFLLEYGLGQVVEGSLILKPQLSQEGLTLYPKEKRGRRKSRKGRADLVNTTYRGIPDETWEALKSLARHYPIWQVANKLIEHGLSHLENGELNLHPQSYGTKTLY